MEFCAHFREKKLREREREIESELKELNEGFYTKDQTDKSIFSVCIVRKYTTRTMKMMFTPFAIQNTYNTT